MTMLADGPAAGDWESPIRASEQLSWFALFPDYPASERNAELKSMNGFVTVAIESQQSTEDRK